MKFGKEFQTHLEQTLPEWRDKFLCYKPLKKLLKHIAADDVSWTALGDDHPDPNPSTVLSSPDLQDSFVQILGEELDKFNDFYVDKEEEFVIGLRELKNRIEHVRETSSKDRLLTSDTETSKEIITIRKDFVRIHGEMVLLKSYSSLNFAGLIKILKKYNKRTGGLLRLPFTQLAQHQPFFVTEPLTRLVQECEANLELLFPLEAELVQCTTAGQDQTMPPNNEMKNSSVETSPSLGEATVDIYKSTLAAMRTIMNLKRASSTRDPLLFAFIFGSQDNESTGAVTAENSPCNSLATLQKTEQEDRDDGYSHLQNSPS